MVYLPHWRVQASGVARSSDATDLEIWSWSFALGNLTGTDLPTDLLSGEALGLCQDINDAIGAYWTDDNAQISQQAVLTLVKIAPLDASGSYAGEPYESAHNTPGGLAVNQPYPLQVAQAVSLNGPSAIHPVRGRWYMPAPAEAIDPATFSWSASQTGFASTAAKDFLDAVNSAIFDHFPFSFARACIASKKGAGQNAPITTISVGSVPDTIRRRRNALLEARSVKTLDTGP